MDVCPCLRQGNEPAVVVPEASYPPSECPYLDEAHPNGRILNIADRFPDGSMRLVRDVPVGTPTWKELYHRARNAVEGRNAAFEEWHLKRMPVFGLPRVKAFIFIVDSLVNLMTLARLVYEATTADRAA